MTSDSLSTEQLAEAKEYGRRKLVCTIVDIAIDLTFLLCFSGFFAQSLDGWLLQDLAVHDYWLRLAAFFLIMVLLHQAISLPLSFYSGFILEHQFHLSRQSSLRWFGRFLLQNGLAITLGLLLIEGLFVIIWLTGGYWWLVAAAASFFVSVALGQLAPVLILPLFYKVERLKDDNLLERFRGLAEGTGLKIEGVYRMQLSKETVKANAMLAGMGNTRRVILGDTLLDEFTPDEIKVVLAHEVGHHVYRHIFKFLAAGVVFSLASFYLCDIVLSVSASSLESGFSYSNVPVASVAPLLLAITLFSHVVSPIQNAVSRRFERQCDQYALDNTGLNEAYRSAFTKLATMNKADPDPHPLEVFLFHDHPPIAERLAMGEEGSGFSG